MVDNKNVYKSFLSLFDLGYETFDLNKSFSTVVWPLQVSVVVLVEQLIPGMSDLL